MFKTLLQDDLVTITDKTRTCNQSSNGSGKMYYSKGYWRVWFVSWGTFLRKMRCDEAEI